MSCCMTLLARITYFCIGSRKLSADKKRCVEHFDIIAFMRQKRTAALPLILFTFRITYFVTVLYANGYKIFHFKIATERRAVSDTSTAK